MSKNQKIILVVVGLFIVAILVNVVMNREYFTEKVKDVAANPTNVPENPGTGAIGSGDASGNVFSELVQQLLGQTPSSTELGVGSGYSNTELSGAYVPPAITGVASTPSDASGNPLDASGSTIDWKGDIDQIKNILKGMVLSTKDNQNCNAAAYSLDKTAQQPCAEGTGKTTPEPTPSLQQGMDYSGCGVQDNSCPYGQGQQLAKKAKPYPIDMNDYIRKDSIPCYGCNIK